MNEQFQSVLIELFKQASSSVGSIIDFGKQEIPELVKEFLLYNGILNISIMIFIAAAGIFVYKKIKSLRDKILKSQSDAMDAFEKGEDWTRLRVMRAGNENLCNAPSTTFNAIMSCKWIVVLNIMQYITLAVSTALFLWYAKTAFLIVFAPRLYLIQVAMDMYKNIN